MHERTLTPMKLAYASSAFARAIDRGDCTQIEFVELCARELACDGVVLDASQFPRTDDDYLAQIRKMTADLGLDVAALWDRAFFTADDDAMHAALAVANAVGAPLLSAPLAAETALSWSAQLDRLCAAASLAKRANVTLALRNAPRTFAASAYDLKRAVKETDSAWLRCGLEPALLDADDAASLAANTVLLWADSDARLDVFAPFAAFRGYLTLDDAAGQTDGAQAKTRVMQWRALR